MQLPAKVIIKKDNTLDVKSKHKFSICNSSGKVLYHAYEQSHTASRLLLKKKRPLKVKVIDSSMQSLMLLERPYTMSYPKYHARTGAGSLGTITRKFSASSRIFEIDRITCTSKYRDPWTYIIERDGKVLGKITNDSGTLHVDLGSTNRPLFLAIALAVLFTMFAR